MAKNEEETKSLQDQLEKVLKQAEKKKRAETALKVTAKKRKSLEKQIPSKRERTRECRKRVSPDCCHRFKQRDFGHARHERVRVRTHGQNVENQPQSEYERFMEFHRFQQMNEMFKRENFYDPYRRHENQGQFPRHNYF